MFNNHDYADLHDAQEWFAAKKYFVITIGDRNTEQKLCEFKCTSLEEAQKVIAEKDRFYQKVLRDNLQK